MTEQKSKARKLSEVHKLFLVSQLACYASPKQAAEALKQEFNVEITPQAAQHYDPTKSSGRTLAKHLVTEFEAKRDAFLKHIEDHIPGANKAVRVARLERAAVAYEAQGNYMAMAEMTVLQAKELGDVHTNRREYSGRDGKPIQFENVREMTDEQVDAELSRLWSKATGSGAESDEDEAVKH